jgi:hypothetical protein
MARMARISADPSLVLWGFDDDSGDHNSDPGGSSDKQETTSNERLPYPP